MFLERIDLSIEIIVLHEKILTKLLNVLSHGSSFSLINHNLNESIGSMICFFICTSTALMASFFT